MNIVWGIVAIIVIIGIVSLQENSAKNKVKTWLEDQGFKDVKIIAQLFTGSKGTLTFEVEYRDNHGELQKNSCVIHTSMFSDEKIYWEKPLE